MSWLLPALCGLEQAVPERQLHLLFGDTPALLEALRRGHADGIVTSARLTSAGLRYARLHEVSKVRDGGVGTVRPGGPRAAVQTPAFRHADSTSARCTGAGFVLFRAARNSFTHARQVK